MNKKLVKLLQDKKVKHEIITHRIAYTAYDVAATLHLKLNQIAKSLLVKTNKPLAHGTKPYALVVVPADKNVDLKKLAKIMSTKDVRVTKVEIPKEGIMKSQFKVKPGSMSAFGSLYKLPVFVDKAVKGQMIFSAGSFEESIKIKAEDFVKIENAKIGSFSVAKKLNKKKKKK